MFVERAPGVWELSFAPDGRATFAYGPHVIAGEPHIEWRRIGDHSSCASPERGLAAVARLLFTLELQRRLTEAGSAFRAVAVHPGWSATNLQAHTESRLQDGLMAIANRIYAQSDDQGALKTFYAATQDIPGGSYVGPDGFREGRGHPTLVGRSDAASDSETARRLWELSERLTATHFPLAPAAA